MLIFKLTITPLLIGLISLADKRWGATVGGWLIGLPLTSAPITAFVALEVGPAFAAQMALGILMGLLSQALFCITYAWLASRLNWLGCWLIGWAVFGLSTLIMNQLTLPIMLVFLMLIVVLGLILARWPSINTQGGSAAAPAWALWGRMGAATSMVVILTSSARWLGPQLSGLLAPLPIFATVFTIFAHSLQGVCPARQILHGVIVSSFACATFFIVIGSGIERWGLGWTFCIATCAALLTQAVMLSLVQQLRKKAS